MMPRPSSATAFRHRPERIPFEAKEIGPGTNLDREARTAQVELLRRAEEGEEAAIEKLRNYPRGRLLRWECKGRRII